MNRTEQTKAPRILGVLITASFGLLAGTNATATAQSQHGASVANSTHINPDADFVRRIVQSLENARSNNRGGLTLPPAVTDTDYFEIDPDQAELGKLLFHDKILSGNMNVSCATCHNMLTDTSDGLSLSVGEGGIGLGPARETGAGSDAVPERVPRNAPHVFNIGAFEFETMMHDGRIAADPTQPSGFKTPAGDDMLTGLTSVVAAQACFPITSGTEMAGQPGENQVADAAAAGDFSLVWRILAKRVARVPEYAQMMMDIYPDVNRPNDIKYQHIAEAIASYEFAIGRSDNSPFDQFLRGDSGAMSSNAVEGMTIFYGEANCVECHSGSFQTNHSFASIAMPQIGPGKGHNQPGYTDGHDDIGLAAQSGNDEDLFMFRVPSLRNVALTAPYGHSGAYATLEGVVRHHLDPVFALENYDTTQAVLPYADGISDEDFVVMNDPARVAGIAASNQLSPVALSDYEIARLLDFLNALTDTKSIDLRFAIPQSVPSGLPVFD